MPPHNARVAMKYSLPKAIGDHHHVTRAIIRLQQRASHRRARPEHRKQPALRPNRKHLVRGIDSG
jgi:hypothetical protein